jgi:hypothetical protein
MTSEPLTVDKMLSVLRKIQTDYPEAFRRRPGDMFETRMARMPVIESPYLQRTIRRVIGQRVEPKSAWARFWAKWWWGDGAWERGAVIEVEEAAPIYMFENRMIVTPPGYGAIFQNLGV